MTRMPKSRSITVRVIRSIRSTISFPTNFGTPGISVTFCRARHSESEGESGPNVNRTEGGTGFLERSAMLESGLVGRSS